MNKLIKFYVAAFFINLTFVETIQSIYFQYRGYSFSSISILLAILQISQFIFEIPTGYIADRFGKKISVICAQLLIMTGYIITVSTNTYYVLIIVMILIGIGNTLKTGAIDALLIDECIDENNKDMLVQVNSISRIIYYVAYGISSLTSGVIAEYSFEMVYILNISSLLVAIFILTRIPNKKNFTEKEDNIKYSAIYILKYIISNKYIFYSLWIELGIAFAMIPIDSFYMNYLVTTFGISTGVVGCITCIQFIVCCFVGLFSIHAEKKIGTALMVKGAPVIMMVLFAISVSVKEKYICLFFYFLALCAFCIYNPVMYKMTQTNILPEYRATVISVISIFRSILAACTQQLFGAIADLFNMQYSMSCLTCISILILLVVNWNFRKLEI